ncbi:fasciclin domain-containing protein [Sphaerisporangium sp. NPDC051017]|uniref:fasciclin domain-containing protein n=1 Tax=Sphaerisporangium sp. NPDC051017 TaxID=3154636 RepID=UPI0034160121
MRTRLLALPIVAALSLATVTTAARGSVQDLSPRYDRGTLTSASAWGLVTPASVQASPLSSVRGVMAAPVGPACKSLPSSGRGSLADLGRLRVDTAAAHLPDLSTFHSALVAAGLTSKLNSAKNITVFAPTNEAFDKLGKRKLNKLEKDKAALTKILTYHVVQGRKTPADLKKGDFTTLEGGKLTTKGSGGKIKVEGAKVLCGDIPTRNANLYLIDSVLTPKG